MSDTGKFEDLKCWQNARKLVNEIYSVTRKGELAKDYDFRSQIRRAAISTMNNIAEGYTKFSKKEFVKYLDTSAASAGEVKSMLYIVGDQNYLDNENLVALHNLTDETKALTLGLLKYIVDKYKLR